jgi:CRP/FNR family transcriptional regulator/CRP/FNR family cyclic AMP-dependent transcriptional regulator
MQTALTTSPLFAALPPKHLDALTANSRRRLFRRGETIFRHGDVGNALYFLETGRVKVVVTSEQGDDVLLAVLGSGEVFGELSVFDGLPRSATVEVLEDATVLSLDRQTFQDYLRNEPEVAFHLLATLSRRLRTGDAMVEDCAFLDVPGRLAKKLLDLAEQHGSQTPDGLEIDLRLTQRELAGMVAASRESVNKHLAYFRQKGLVGLHRGHLVIRKPEDLARRAR